jgi:hypothetical protein
VSRGTSQLEKETPVLDIFYLSLPKVEPPEFV